MDKKKIGVGVGVMLMKNGKILLGQRHVDALKASSELQGAGQWTMPGGKLEFGETLEACAKRETFEETGISLHSVEAICINDDIAGEAHYVTIGLMSSDFDGEPQALEPDVITRWEWFSPDDLPSPMYRPSSKVLKNYIDKKFYIPQK
ncbi:MAG: NUDIX domain-containing protein [Candidatus Kaiserbacteria bacterium]|nr:NUDIX domain-containing protein [Candidatus Kaiserbacteria bacterium]